MTDTPEQKARRDIEADLESAGWIVQNREALDLTAGRGIAVREFPLKPGFGRADYLHNVISRAMKPMSGSSSLAQTN